MLKSRVPLVGTGQAAQRFRMGRRRSPAMPILRRIFLIFFCNVIYHDELQIAEY